MSVIVTVRAAVTASARMARPVWLEGLAGFGCCQMWSTMTSLTEPPASLKKIPYSTFELIVETWNPAAGPVIVRFWMFIVCARRALVTIPPFH